MIKKDIAVKRKKGLYYLVKEDNGIQRFKPWLGDAFSFLYDLIMEKSIFPKKFGGEMARHVEILRGELGNIRNRRVLELATGSGEAVRYLDNSNRYAGLDISPGLLKIAAGKFAAAGFEDPRFFVASADDLPFADDVFDVCLCLLSFNFFHDASAVVEEIKRVLRRGGEFFCSVPVPERRERSSPIHGTLYSEEEFESMFQAGGFDFQSLPGRNGALLYFKAVVK
ncbi:MAG: class I SAM-dependent methyltransferase [Candidatus Krumholzibacteriota bacterium]|nr:class I SAM-dependent methyltransferase [Candidatus Krumholzibacteriota bacterium]